MHVAYARVSLFVCFLLFYAIATAFQLYHGGDMMYEIRRKLEPTRLQTQWIFNLPHHIEEEVAFDDTISYTQWVNGLQHS